MSEAEKTGYEKYVSFYKSVLDQDRNSIVICNLQHEIIYMNAVAFKNYERFGGEQLMGKNLLDCHNPKSRERIEQVVQWFAESKEHNLIYTFHKEKQNVDVYMVALRDGEMLIGYYEKHENRDRETMGMYEFGEGNVKQD